MIIVGVITWEKIISILMKTYSKDTICEEKGFFDSISMMDININVYNSWIIFEEFKCTKHNVINVAKTTGLFFLSMM